jgi:hypothetical protein
MTQGQEASTVAPKDLIIIPIISVPDQISAIVNLSHRITKGVIAYPDCLFSIIERHFSIELLVCNPDYLTIRSLNSDPDSM